MYGSYKLLKRLPLSSANLGLANKQWVDTNIRNYVNDYFTSHHYASTESASAVSGRLENGSFYYKLSK